MQKGATPRGVGAEVMYQGMGLLDHLFGADEAPTSKEDLESILGFDRDTLNEEGERERASVTAEEVF